MRVGVLSIPLPTSGTETYHRTLIQGLARFSSHDIVGIDPIGSVRSDVPSVTYNLVYRRWAYFVRWFVDIEQRNIRDAIKRASVDALVLNNQGLPVPRGIRLPTVAYVVESPVTDTKWGVIAHLVLRNFGKFADRTRRRADWFVAISENERRRFVETYGVDDARTRVGYPSAQPFPDDLVCPVASKFVVYAGWQHPRKNISTLARAWRLAIEKGLDRDLVLMGPEGPADRVYGSVARRVLDVVGTRLMSRVHILGSVSGRVFGGVLKAADAMVTTSLHEGFGIPVLEAYSFGTPVVAVDSGSLPEASGPHGRVVRPDPESIAEGLVETVVSPPRREDLIAYAESFTLERQAAPFIEALDQIEARLSR